MVLVLRLLLALPWSPSSHETRSTSQKTCLHFENRNWFWMWACPSETSLGHHSWSVDPKDKHPGDFSNFSWKQFQLLAMVVDRTENSQRELLLLGSRGVLGSVLAESQRKEKNRDGHSLTPLKAGVCLPTHQHNGNRTYASVELKSAPNSKERTGCVPLFINKDQDKHQLPDLKGRHDRPLEEKRHRQQSKPFGLPGGLQQSFPGAPQKSRGARETRGNCLRALLMGLHCLPLANAQAKPACHAHHRPWMCALEQRVRLIP